MPFDTICTLPLASPLFALSTHPTLPLLTVGLASGHVQTYRLPHTPEAKTPLSNNAITIAWKTKRHVGSCRALTVDSSGEKVYSAGAEGIIKLARIDDGRVTAKFAVPYAPSGEGEVDPPTVLSVLSPDVLLVGTDSGQVYVFDAREDHSTHTAAGKGDVPHGGEFISSITPLPPVQNDGGGGPGTARQFLSTGGSTLSLTDLRKNKGVIETSEDQEEELSCSLLATAGGGGGGEKVLVGQANGAITLWNRGKWDDPYDRVVVSRDGSSVDCITALPSTQHNHGLLGSGVVAAGLDDGHICFLNLNDKKVVKEWEEVTHDEVDGVVAVAFDCEGRMVSGGGAVVKVWHFSQPAGRGENGVDDDDEEQSNHDREEVEEIEDEENDSEEEEQRSKRKKRKRNRGKDHKGGVQIGKIVGLG